MKKRCKYLGIDIGSVAISVALINDKKEVVQTAYGFHEGRIADKLTQVLSAFDLAEISGIACTSSTPEIVNCPMIYDSRISIITAARHLFPEVGSILIVGGEKFGLVRFDEKGQYRKFKSNSSCAAGTGSFLDQQAKRLNLDSIAEFSRLANNNTGDFPRIASRCSVFAKTDLIHAQQEGYSLPEICDGLCYGLAKNIADTLLDGSKINLPMVFAGGVSLNKAVAKHFEKLSGIKPLTGKHSNLYGAIGAAILMVDEKDDLPERDFKTVDDIITTDKKDKEYFFRPLRLELSDYPDFSSEERYLYKSKLIKNIPAVEVDIYTSFEPKTYRAWLGIDIGSTSTKAVLLDREKNVLAGFYTRTSGQPVYATRSIFEAIQNIVDKKGIGLEILGAGTTGSGRKFIGKIIGADIVPDEITAHARAAVELDGEVDTIIEIGGQDAKFTTLKNGSVTFSAMNNVCAAGTGSFIEEQAKKLGVGLDEYSDRAENTAAPMASDRCTVFMERDLNHYINENYKTNEILASVLHSVRENYLAKVATVKNIGNKIFFQGATAKNRALVAAFEQKLGRPIMVSKYCHLTGALGVALELFDKQVSQTAFRGIKLYKTEIPVRTEVCSYCTNSCKLKIAEVEGETEAYGFLCGRDYDSKKFIDNNTSGFNLVKEYNKHFRFVAENSQNATVTVGIPSGLYLFSDLFLWQRFFDLLNIRTITSTRYPDALKSGKTISGAEFCAPMTAIQGQVKYLIDKVDFVFLPTYLEDQTSTRKKRRQYCYYSQFAPPVVASVEELEVQDKILNPLLFSLQNETAMKTELFKSLQKAGIRHFGFSEISNAYNRAKKENTIRNQAWRNRFTELNSPDREFNVVLLGRPYTILSPIMNNNIPEIFAQKGVKTFYHDMLGVNENEIDSLREILGETKWKFAAAILSAADHIARTKGLYPVFVSSFKCAPDSFIIDYFKQIMDFYNKPYLILQLDEYSSNVGYETRIEAALRSFTNHFVSGSAKRPEKVSLSYNNTISKAEDLKDKILLMPNLGDYSSKLIEAVLRHYGVETYTLYDSNDSIKKSLVSNSGQCLPLNIILQDAIDFIEKNKLDPSKVVIWMLESPIACNLGMFINFMSKQLKELKPEYGRITIFRGDITFTQFSVNVSVNIYLAFLLGGYLRKMECKLRPYEKQKGQTDAVLQKSLQLFYETLEKGLPKEPAVKRATGWFKEIETVPGNRPKVAIFGDLYARDNDVFNQNLIRFIEENGGEAVTTSYSDYIKIVFFAANNRIIKEGYYMRAAVRRFLISLVTQIENRYLKYFNEILNEPVTKPLKHFEESLELAHLKTDYNGESLENVLKVIHLTRQHPEIALFVQTNPSYCCPSLVTEAMAAKLEKISGVPIVTIEYDGTSSSKNEVIIPFLKYSRASQPD